MRVSTSEGPPAGNGTTILIDRMGKAAGRLGERRDIGHRLRSIAVELRQRSQLTARDQRRYDLVGGVDELDASGQEPVDRLRRALEWHIDDVESRRLVE